MMERVEWSSLLGNLALGLVQGLQKGPSWGFKEREWTIQRPEKVNKNLTEFS